MKLLLSDNTVIPVKKISRNYFILAFVHFIRYLALNSNCKCTVLFY